MQLSVQSVLSAAKCAVGGGTIIPFRLTTTLDSVRATNDKYVKGRDTFYFTKHIEEYPRAYQIRNKDVNTRTRIMFIV